MSCKQYLTEKCNTETNRHYITAFVKSINAFVNLTMYSKCILLVCMRLEIKLKHLERFDH